MKFLGRWYVAFLLILFGITGAYFVQDPVSDFLSDLLERGRLAGFGGEEKKELALTPTIDVTLYFGSAGGDMLAPLSTKVEEGESVVRTLHHVLNALIAGPQKERYAPVVPPGTKIRTLFPGVESTLYIDFNRSFRDDHPGGAWTEMLTAQAVANTVLKNFGESFERVILLIEGQEALTIAGAYAISGPFRFRDDIIAKFTPDVSSSPEPGKPAGPLPRPGPVGLPAESKSPESLPAVPPVGVPSPADALGPVGAPGVPSAGQPEAGASSSAKSVQ
jgi:hypothetical protein